LTTLEGRVRRVIEIADEMKGQDMTALDLRGISDFTDAFVIVTGTSSTHLQAIIRKLHDDLAREGMRPLSKPESGSERWGVLDYADVIVHVFEERTREYYDLEGLWADAKILDCGIESNRRGVSQTA
jgi:ribosome-associated protein